MSKSKDLFVIGNADEAFIKSHLEGPFTVGVGYKEKWFVAIDRCVEDILALLRLNKMLNLGDIVNIAKHIILQGKQADAEKIVRKYINTVTDDEILKEVIKAINKAVVEEVVHAYGDVGHRVVYRIKYQNENEKEQVLNILKKYYIQQWFEVEYLIFTEENGKFEHGEYHFRGKSLDANMYKRYEEMMKKIRASLPREIKISKGIRYEYGSKEFDGLLGELGKFGLE